MARTDHVTATLVKWMEKGFNTPEHEPPGGLSGPVQLRAGVQVPALDNFQECSLAWVMAGYRGRSDSFPTMTETAKCGGIHVAQFTIGIARCTTEFETANGWEFPSPEVSAQEFGIQEDDKDRLEKVSCAAVNELLDAGRITHYGLAPLDVIGPSGATVAVYRDILVGLNN